MDRKINLYDILILGGGVAGCAAALHLLQQPQPLRVAIVEGGDYTKPRVGETIAPGVDVCFRTLGIWDQFIAQNHLKSLGASSSWGSEEVLTKDFIFSPYQFGWHLDRNRFDAMLAGEAAARGATLLTRTRAVAINRKDNIWQVSLKNRDGHIQSIEARMIFEARGRAAKFPQELGAQRLHYDRLTAVVGTFDLLDTLPENDNTLIETTPSGWWHASRLPQNQMVATWFSDADLITTSGMNDPDKWMAALQATTHVQTRIGAGKLEPGLTTYSAQSYILTPMYGDGWIAIGDAAAAHDPLSSSGIHRALQSGMKAASAAIAALQGDNHELAAYNTNLRAAFDTYLSIWQQYYQMEQRWPGSAFWKRRQETITLDPMAQLQADMTGSTAAVKLQQASHHLKSSEYQRLYELCQAQRPAHEIVRSFQATNGKSVPDQKVILGLQELLKEEVIVVKRS